MKKTIRDYYIFVCQLPQSIVDLIDFKVETILLKEGYSKETIQEARSNVFDSKISDVDGLIDISDLIGKDTNGYYIDITIETENDYYYHYSV